jgi:hypothetical protein
MTAGNEGFRDFPGGFTGFTVRFIYVVAKMLWRQVRE